MAPRPKRGPYPEGYVPSDQGSLEWSDYNKPTVIVDTDSPKIDIVFVHGLGSRWQQTWCGSDGFSWLEEMLPGELPPARVLVTGFNCLPRIDGTLSTLEDGCTKIIEDVEATRKDAKRPLVFVGHSLGGLIIQHALSKVARQSLCDSIKGLVFFCTPHFDSNIDAWTDFRKQIGKMIDDEKPVNVNSSSLTRLGNINKHFEGWLRNQNFSPHVYRFYEGLPVYRLGFIVPKDKCEDTATVDSEVISGDHLSMIKFEDVSDSGYQVVLKRLKTIISCKDSSASPSIMTQSSIMTRSLAFSAPTRAPTNASQVSCPDAREFILASGNVNVKLALALEDQGQYAAAEEAYQDAIDELTENIGEGDRLTLYCMDKLASLLRDRSRYEEASKISKNVLTTRIRQLGLGESPTLSSVGNLALIMRYQSKQQEAFAMIRNALENNETRPLDSMTRIRVVSVLAKIYRDHGAYDECVLLSRDVARASGWWLGEDHPYTLNRLSDLTVAYSTSDFKSNYLVAEDLGHNTLDALEKSLGRDHPNALRTARRLGNYERFQGKHEIAFKRLEETWMRQKDQLGASHPATLSTMTALASVSVLKGYVGDAKQALKESFHEQTEVLGANHQATLWTSEALNVLQVHGVAADSNAKSCKDIDPEVKRYFMSPSSITQKVSLDPVPVPWASTQPQETALLQAINGDSLDKVITALDGLTDQDILGRGLRAAAYLGKEPITRLLLERGAPIDSCGGYYGTALQAACGAGNIYVVKLLLEMNADVNLQAGLFNTALRSAVFSGHSKIIDLLLEMGADPNIHSECSTALQVAVSKGDPTTVQKLLDRKADPNASDQLFGTPLQEAAFLGTTSIVALLIKHGADPNLAGGLYGSAMQAALRASNRDTVKCLMDNGADASSYNMLNAIIESGMDLLDVSFGRHTSDLYVMEPHFAPHAEVSKLSFSFKKKGGLHLGHTEARRKEEYFARAKTPPGRKSRDEGRDRSKERSAVRRFSKTLKLLQR